MAGQLENRYLFQFEAAATSSLFIEGIFGTLRKAYIGVTVGAAETGGVITTPFTESNPVSHLVLRCFEQSIY